MCQVLFRGCGDSEEACNLPEMAQVAWQGRGLALIHQTQGQEAHQGWQKAETTRFLIWLEWGFLCSSHGLALHLQFAAY